MVDLIQVPEDQKIRHAKFQDFCMYRYFHIIYVFSGFLKFYTDKYCENNLMVLFSG
jgi:hypothetical protein